MILDYIVYTDKDCKTAKEVGTTDGVAKSTWLTAANLAYKAVSEGGCTGTETTGFANKACVAGKSATISFFAKDDKTCKTALAADKLDTVSSDGAFTTAKAPTTITYGACVANGDTAGEWVVYTNAKAIGASLAAAALAAAATLY